MMRTFYQAKILVAAGLLAMATAGQAAPLGAAGPVIFASQSLVQIDVLGSARSLAQANLIPDLGRERKSGKSAAEAVREARERYGGKVLSVTREGDYYRVKLIHNGNLRIVRIAAN